MSERVELELELSSDGGSGYRIDVRSEVGEETGRLTLDPAPVLRNRVHLQSTVLASATSARGARDMVEAPVRRVGEALFRALFDDDNVYAAYKSSLALAADRGTQLRVVLRAQAAELAALPWEMLFDPDAEAYLCAREPLVRHVSVSGVTRPLRVAPPLRILGVVSAPRDQSPLDVEGEKDRLRTSLAPLGSRVSLRWVEGGRWSDVQRELVSGSWHVLHFVGHGGFDAEDGEGVLALENDAGETDMVGAERFGDLLTLQVPPLQLVVLNSCAGAQAAADDLFSSTAATLARTGVAAVVAMQFAVSDPAAKAFAAGFYQAIAHNHSIAEAVRIGRIGIRGTGEGTLEWITPVLYLRGDDAPLFEVVPSPEQRDEEPTLEPQEAAEQVGQQALREQAMSRDGRDQAVRDAQVTDGYDAVTAEVPALRDELREHAAAETRELRLRPEPAAPAAPPPTPATPTRPAPAPATPTSSSSTPSRSRMYLLGAAAVVLVLVGGGVVRAMTSGPPAPFESDALHEIGRHHFDPDDCTVPESKAQAPLAFDLPHTELLKCTGPDDAYTGTLLCADSEAELETVRQAFLGGATGEPQPITGLPAGREDPWPFQVSFAHKNGGGSRVYWDDADLLCAGELQVRNTDATVAVAHFEDGA